MEKENVKETSNKNRSILKTIILLVLILLIIGIIIIARNAIILNSLSKKLSQTRKNDNYSIEMYMYQKDDTCKIKVNHKNNSVLASLTDKNTKITEIGDGNTTNIYVNSQEDKYVKLNSESYIANMATPNIFDINNIKDLLGNSLIPIIKDSKCNGKDCYYIKTSKIKNLVTGNEPIEIYIEKATGLPIRILQGPISTSNNTTNTIIDFDYNFNNVNDDDLKITDIEQYRIQK